LPETAKTLANFSAVPTELLKTLKTVETAIAAIPDPTDQDAARDYLTVAQDRLQAYRTAALAEKRAEERTVLTRKVYETYGTVSTSVHSRQITGMSVDALVKLRGEVQSALSQKAKELESQLARLGEEIGVGRKRGVSTLKGRKVPIKYRDRSGNTWAGRGAMPVWLRDKIKAGAKLDDFAVDKSSRAPRKKAKKRGKAKR
jgi:DNA-binding protein H-NS